MGDQEKLTSEERSSVETIVSDLKSGDQNRIDGAIGTLERTDAHTLTAACELFMENLLWACYRKDPSESPNEPSVLRIVGKAGEQALAYLRKLTEKQGNYRLVILSCILLAKTNHPAYAPGARAKLAAYVEGPDEYQGRDAIEAMVTIGDEHVVDYLRLVTLANHPSQYIRADSANALGLIGDERAIPDLEKALQDPSWSNVRPIARLALNKLRHKKG